MCIRDRSIYCELCSLIRRDKLNSQFIVSSFCMRSVGHYRFQIGRMRLMSTLDLTISLVPRPQGTTRLSHYLKILEKVWKSVPAVTISCEFSLPSLSSDLVRFGLWFGHACSWSNIDLVCMDSQAGQLVSCCSQPWLHTAPCVRTLASASHLHYPWQTWVATGHGLL